MPSRKYDISSTELSLIIVLQLGFCLLLLAQIADATSGYETLLGVAGYLVGGVTVVGAVLILVARRRFGLEIN